ncbi:mediator complex subunit, partial [Ascosphaera atra]
MEKATNNSKDLQVVTSMADAGFEFPPGAPGMHSAFSPNACLAVMLDANHHVRLRHMEHPALQRHEEEPEEK